MLASIQLPGSLSTRVSPMDQSSQMVVDIVSDCQMRKRPPYSIICPLKAKMGFKPLPTCIYAEGISGGRLSLREVRVAGFCESEISSG